MSSIGIMAAPRPDKVPSLESRWCSYSFRNIVAGVDTIKIGGNNVEYSFVPGRVRIKAGSTLKFTNVGDLPHGATAWQTGDWDTGVLPKGLEKSITFEQPGVYYYICTPHPWMYGQVIVE